MESFRFTKYTDECCKILEESPEFDTDRYLARLVRIIHLAENINHTITVGETHSAPGLSAPLGLSLRWHQAELQKLRDSSSYEQPHAGMSKQCSLDPGLLNANIAGQCQSHIIFPL
jgi:hypothetical protein